MVYEVVWTRLFTVVLGNTVSSVTSILTVFMAGLALGSWLAGRFVDRGGLYTGGRCERPPAAFGGSPPLGGRESILPLVRGRRERSERGGRSQRLARTYAILEAAIGLYNLALPFLLKSADPVFSALYSDAYRSAMALGLVRFGISFLLLIVPATLMGASLPVLVRLFSDNVGRLYAANTLGAAAGAASAGLLLVPLLGTLATLRLAAAVNLSIAIAAWILQPSIASAGATATEESDNESGPRIVLVAMLLSGFGALIDEVAWTRVLGLVVGPTTYAFTLMLCSMIAGLGLGAAVGARFVIPSFRASVRLLAWIELAIGLASLALVPLFGVLPLWIGRLVARYSASFRALESVEFVLFFALMAIPTFLFGITFPLASRIYAKSNTFLGSEVGAIYAFNTIGGIAGSLAAGLVLIPMLGSQSTMIAAGFVNIGVCLLLARQCGVGGPATCHQGVVPREAQARQRAASRDGARPVGPTLKKWAARTIAAVAIVAGFLIPGWNLERMTSGAYKYAPGFVSHADLETTLSSGEVLYFKEGPATAVSVRKFRGALSLSVDGKVDATDAGDMTTQKMLAHLPLLLSPNRPDKADQKTVAIIGLGSGVTAGAALRHPIERLDVVEISPEVVEASRLFSHVNQGALSDPRTELIVGDGRNHLRYTHRLYDVIVSEPSNPWMSGMASLFTREFFSEARARLAPGGLHCQWFHSYNMSLDDLRTVVATFRSVFPHARLWALTKYDFIMLGSSSPITINEDVFGRNFTRVAADLATIKVQDSYSVLSSLLLTDEELDRFAAGAPLNTDDLPVLEFRAPRSLYANTTDDNLRALQAVSKHTEKPALKATAENHRHKAEMLAAAEDIDSAIDEFKNAIALDPDDVQSLLSAAALYSRRDENRPALELLDRALVHDPSNVRALEALTDALSEEGSPRLSEATDRLLKAAPDNPTGLYHRAAKQLLQRRFDEAAAFQHIGILSLEFHVDKLSRPLL